MNKNGKILALVGDSTVQDYPVANSKRGWGQMLPKFIKKDISIFNFAVGGTSTKTFRSEGHWGKVFDVKPDFVLIQFGHNDSHDKEKPESTIANKEYKDLLELYIKEARESGIRPFLITPPHRRIFKNGKLDQSLKPYADNMKTIAEKMFVPLIDLFLFTEEKMEKIGEDKCIPLFCSKKDRSHFSEQGAQVLATYIAEELKKDKPSDFL